MKGENLLGMYRVLHDSNPLQAHIRAYAGWIAVVLGALAIAFVANGPAGAQDGEELSNPVAFAETSYANVCAECHGDRGAGGSVPGTDRRAPAPDADDEIRHEACRAAHRPLNGDWAVAGGAPSP